jgi:hypothetical protein
MKAVYFILTALLLVGCEDTYRYPCQDPANKDKAECNRPLCEADGFCYDKLNGLPEQEATPSVEEAAPAADCNKVEETTGE